MTDSHVPEGVESYLRSVLRLVAGFLFFQHGLQKWFGMFGGMGGSGAAAEFNTLVWWAGVLEAAGGILIIAGLFTRITAFVLSGQMAVAYFIGHAARGFWPIENGGELAALYCFLFLYLAAAGPGIWSADSLLMRAGRKRRPAGSRSPY